MTKLPDDGGNEEDHALVVRTKAVETKIKGIQRSLWKESKTIHTKKKEMFCTTPHVDQATVMTAMEHLQKVIESYMKKNTLNETYALHEPKP